MSIPQIWWEPVKGLTFMCERSDRGAGGLVRWHNIIMLVAGGLSVGCMFTIYEYFQWLSAASGGSSRKEGDDEIEEGQRDKVVVDGGYLHFIVDGTAVIRYKQVLVSALVVVLLLCAAIWFLALGYVISGGWHPPEMTDVPTVAVAILYLHLFLACLVALGGMVVHSLGQNAESSCQVCESREVSRHPKRRRAG